MIPQSDFMVAAPVIRVMAEGENAPFIEEVVDGIVAALTKAAA